MYSGEAPYYQQLSLRYKHRFRSAKSVAVRKHHKRPEPADAWSWLARRAAAAGIDLHQISLTEAAHCAVSRLEEQRDGGLPLSPETVQLATLLVRLEGKWIASSASSAEPFVERAYLREWARLLAYKTTRHFLIEFGLQSLEELPAIEELQQRVGFPLDLENSLIAASLPRFHPLVAETLTSDRRKLCTLPARRTEVCRGRNNLC